MRVDKEMKCTTTSQGQQFFAAVQVIGCSHIVVQSIFMHRISY